MGERSDLPAEQAKRSETRGAVLHSTHLAFIKNIRNQVYHLLTSTLNDPTHRPDNGNNHLMLRMIHSPLVKHMIRDFLYHFIFFCSLKAGHLECREGVH